MLATWAVDLVIEETSCDEVRTNGNALFKSERSGRHVLLDYFRRNGGSNFFLLGGERPSPGEVENVFVGRGNGDRYCCNALFLHAGRLD